MCIICQVLKMSLFCVELWVAGEKIEFRSAFQFVYCRLCNSGQLWADRVTPDRGGSHVLWLMSGRDL
jgi:hypothetical protein